MSSRIRKYSFRLCSPFWQVSMVMGVLGTLFIKNGLFDWYETPIAGPAWWIYLVSCYGIGYNVLRFFPSIRSSWTFHYCGFLFAHSYVFLFSGWKSSGTYTQGWWLDSYGHGQFFFVTMLMLLHLLLPYLRLIRTRWLRVISFLGLTLACFGLGPIWELVEYRYDIDIGQHIHLLAQEDNNDTMGDLIANGIGLLFAIIFRCLYGLRRRQKHPSESVQDDEDIARIRNLLSEIYALWEEIRGIIEAMRKRHREQNPTRVVWMNMLRELHERSGKMIEGFNRE